MRAIRSGRTRDGADAEARGHRERRIDAGLLPDEMSERIQVGVVAGFESIHGGERVACGEEVEFNGARCRFGCGSDECVEVPCLAVDDLMHDQRNPTGERVARRLGDREESCVILLDGRARSRWTGSRSLMMH